MAQVYLFLFAGLALLFVSGKFLVDSSVAISRRLKIPKMIIGLTVVAFGTSAPELLVSLQAAFSGYPEIAMGNVVGSNISNILLVLAITALIFPIPVPASSVKRDWPMMMAVSLLLFAFSQDRWITRPEGGVLVGLLAGYIAYSVISARGLNATEAPSERKGAMKWWVAVIMFLVSCVGLAFGADLLVDNVALIAEELGISKRVVSVTMVAVGTSIPELATSVIAALKKETEISVGNIIGSNIMNILSVLGLTSLISPIAVSREIASFDIAWMLGASFLLVLLMLPASRSRITRWEGSIMIIIYLLYIYLLF
ncbi:MAG: calcium/sodium antiporter [Bacteroidales bacterium]|nr:calcium/sodium antiporter [Bacteroidales bacterium]